MDCRELGQVGDRVSCRYHGKHREGTIEKNDKPEYIVIAQTSPESGYRTLRGEDIQNWQNHTRHF